MQETQEMQVQSLGWENPGVEPTPVFLPGESHGQRSLVGYSPRGCKRVRHSWATEHTQSQFWSWRCRAWETPWSQVAGQLVTLLAQKPHQLPALPPITAIPQHLTLQVTFQLLFSISYSQLWFSFTISHFTLILQAQFLMGLWQNKEYTEFEFLINLDLLCFNSCPFWDEDLPSVMDPLSFMKQWGSGSDCEIFNVFINQN